MVAAAVVLIVAIAAIRGNGTKTVRSGGGPAASPITQVTPTSQATPTTGHPTTVAPAAPSTSKALYISGPVSIPAGEPGKLSIVLVGSGGTSDSSIPVVIRNNTRAALEQVEVSGVARNVSGSLAGSGSSQGFTPSNVKPGEWAFGYVYFSAFIRGVPAGLKFDLTATGREPSSLSFMKEVDLPIAEVKDTAGQMGRSIVGIVTNTASTTINPVTVDYICFSGTTPLSSGMDFTEGTSGIPAGGTGSFSINLFSEQCPAYALGAHGNEG